MEDQDLFLILDIFLAVEEDLIPQLDHLPVLLDRVEMVVVEINNKQVQLTQVAEVELLLQELELLVDPE